MNFREMTKEQLAEESLIDLAYAVLEERKAAISFNDLVKEVQALNGLSDEQMKSKLVQFYTDMNVDGRFLLNNESGWGLREWYKVETIEEETAPTVKARKKKAKVLVDDEDLEVDLDTEIDFEEDFDEFVEDDEIEEDLDFVAEEIEDIDEDIEDDIEEDILVEDDVFDIEEESEEDEEFVDTDEK